MLQLRRFYRALSFDVCLLCMEIDETVDHLSYIVLWLWGYDTNYSNWLIRIGFLLGANVTWWPSHIRGWEVPLEAISCGKLLVLHRCGLCGGKETLRFFRTSQGLQRLFGILFIYLPPFRPLASQLLRAFPLMLFNLIGFRCVVPKLWASKEWLAFVYSFLYIAIWVGLFPFLFFSTFLSGGVQCILLVYLEAV